MRARRRCSCASPAVIAAEIWVAKEGEEVNGKSIMGLMMLAAGPGIEAAHPLRRTGCRQGHGGTRGINQCALPRRLTFRLFSQPRMSGDNAQEEIRFHGAGVSPGIARGVDSRRARRSRRRGALSHRAVANRERDCALRSRALVQTRTQILEMQQKIAEAIGAKDAAIFDAHLLVVEDRTLIDEVLRKLETDLCNVEWVFQEVATNYAETLSKIDDPYLRERALDIEDVTRRIIRNLQGKAPKTFLALTEPHILVAHNLTPSDTATMNRERRPRHRHRSRQPHVAHGDHGALAQHSRHRRIARRDRKTRNRTACFARRLRPVCWLSIQRRRRSARYGETRTRKGPGHRRASPNFAKQNRPLATDVTLFFPQTLSCPATSMQSQPMARKESGFTERNFFI